MTDVVTRALTLGVRRETPDGPVEKYSGIPYASATRFQSPVLANPHSVPLDATLGAISAPQWDHQLGVVGEEAHCLTLTIWTPAGSEGASLPVLVWIHGGAHMSGSSSNPLSDGGRLAASEQLLVVAVNYRLGALGHLWLADLLGDDYTSSGNLALHDQLTALEWVHAHISEFGGDPVRVTVMGQSSGGVDVLALTASSSDRSLFRGAIAHSASGERASTIEEAVEVRDMLLSALGITADPSAIVDLDLHSLVRAQQLVVDQRSAGRPSTAIPFHPIIDGVLLTGTPLQMLANGAGRHIALLIGSNREEASAWIDRSRSDAESAPDLRSLMEQWLPDVSTAAARVALRADRGHSETTDAQLHEALVSEALYRTPVDRVRECRPDSYAFSFDWAGPATDESFSGASHSLELPFVFRHAIDPQTTLTTHGEEDPIEKLRDRMSGAWAAFVRDGSPRRSEQSWSTYGEKRTVMAWSAAPAVGIVRDRALRAVLAASEHVPILVR